MTLEQLLYVLVVKDHRTIRWDGTYFELEGWGRLKYRNYDGRDVTSIRTWRTISLGAAVADPPWC